MITFHVLTLFPEMFASPFSQGVLSRAQDRGILKLSFYNIRDYAEGPHKSVDDYPYGGGRGMLMMYKPISLALNAVESAIGIGVVDHVILLSPQGKPLNQATVQGLASSEHIVLISGRYEGVDNRVTEHLVSSEISIGDYVVSGGELPSMVLIDAVSRCVPGVLGSDESASNDSYSQGLLEYPQYTRPSTIDGLSVPEVLLSGNHAKIEQWRLGQALNRTRDVRPDLLPDA
jgi:tRNA (guanine37-N1)-methyltransferase